MWREQVDTMQYAALPPRRVHLRSLCDTKTAKIEKTPTAFSLTTWSSIDYLHTSFILGRHAKLFDQALWPTPEKEKRETTLEDCRWPDTVDCEAQKKKQSLKEKEKVDGVAADHGRRKQVTARRQFLPQINTAKRCAPTSFRCRLSSMLHVSSPGEPLSACGASPPALADAED